MSITFNNGGVLIENESELPWFECDTIYLDLETSSGDEKEDSLNPWHHCYVAGIAVTYDDHKTAYYVPVNHHFGRNLDPIKVQEWLVHILSHAKRWVNHNVKYDAQVLHTAFGVDVFLELVCTVVQAKLINSDRFHYDLTSLSRDWLGEEIRVFEERLQPYLLKNKDYGAIPADIMGEYACQDVLTNRRLWRYEQRMLPAESAKISQIEIDTTSVLADIERNGMRVNPTKLAVTQLKTMQKLITLQQQCHEYVGWPFQPHINEDCFDVLCNKYGLPVLGWTDTGNPSFDKEALKAYKTLPGAPLKLIDYMLEYRRMNVFNNTFLTPYRELHVDGLLHSSYNQVVRTGRMSCKMPNGQQLMPEAKELIECDEDEVIISADYSQIEFRLIVHYIKDWAAIDAYKQNPFTDFHDWVKDLCSIHRKPAKTINFLMGYGGGKEKLLSSLMQVPELVGDIQAKVDSLVTEGKLKREDALQLFNGLARKRAEGVYTTYHDSLPGLKRTSRQASNTIMERGFVRNLYGRRRYLAKDYAHRAFNSLCQGSAADLMKERLVALHKWLKLSGLPVWIIGVIHDEVLLRAKRNVVDDRLLDMIAWIMESVTIDLRVPIRTSVGVSSKNWYDASDNSIERQFDRANCPFPL